MVIKIKIYRCNKCTITKHIKSTDYFDGICKCCKNKMEFLGYSDYDTNITPSKIRENNEKKKEEIARRELEAERLRQANAPKVPKCPICQSTELSKLSSISKAAKVGFFGIFGTGDLGKTWKCNNCGSKF